jgi:magnesium chelatase family protein
MRLSGPIVDRIDLRVGLEVVAASDVLARNHGEPSQSVRARVCGARARQDARYGGRIAHNAELGAEEVLDAADATSEALSLLQEHLDRTQASARVGRRMLKVARTLADLDGAERVARPHIAEAITLRLDIEGEAP